jgi:hypothetical protein
MIGDFCFRKQVGRKRVMTFTDNSPRNLLNIMKMEGLNSVYAYWSSKKRKALSGRGMETSRE